MDEQTDGWGGIDGPINELADRWTDEQMDGWISVRVNGWMDRHFYTWLSVCIPVMSKADFSPGSDKRVCAPVCVCACVCLCACVRVDIRSNFCFFYVCVHVHMCVKQLCSADRLSWRDVPQTVR